MFRDLIERVEHAQQFLDTDALRAVIDDAQGRLSGLAEDYARSVLQAYVLMWMGLEQLLKMQVSESGEMLSEALSTFEKLEETAGRASALRFLGKYHLDKSEYVEALESLNASLELTESSLNPEQFAAIHELMGAVHASMSQQGLALESYTQALIVREEIGDPSAIAQVLNNIGTVHSYVAEYDTALREQYRALELYQGAGNEAGIYRVKGNIALQFGHTDQFDKAVELLSELLEHSIRIGDSRGAATTYVNIGYFLLKQQNYDLAVEHLRSGAELSSKGGYTQLEATSVANLAQALIANKKFDDAQRLLDEKQYLEEVLPTEQFEFLKCRALLAEQRGEIAKAEEFLSTALSLATSTEWKSYHADLHKQLRQLYRDRGPLEKYVLHNEEYERISDEIKGEDKQRRMEIAETDQKISVEHRNAEKQRALLYSTMPQHIAERMMLGETTIANSYEDVAVVFMDIVSFTTLSSKVPAEHLIYILSSIFSACDDVIDQHGLTKIKTIGDSYLAVAGLDEEEADHRVVSARKASRACIDLMLRLQEIDVVMPSVSGEPDWTEDVGKIEFRIGVHCGPIVAGVIGSRRPQYDVWGDTVNVAARMETSSLPGKIQVTERVAYAATGDVSPSLHGTKVALENDEFSFTLRGSTDVKGKGAMSTYWLEWDRPTS